MKKRIVAALLSVFIIANFAIPFLALAEDGITVTVQGETKVFAIESNNITNALRNAFSFCASNSDKEYEVKIPEGEYIVSNALTVSDNTTLDLTQGVTLLNSNSNIFITKKNVEKYGGTHDFKVLGGKLSYVEDYEGKSCLIRMAHAENVSFVDTVFSDNRNSHHIELAACSNVLFEGCTFENMQASLSTTSGEALQIDILEEESHFALMPEYDGTMNQNITVNNCTFSNVLRGVGTQSAYAGMYHKNINITNCTFENISSTAITCMNYIDSNISNNTIVNCGQGINYYMIKSEGSLDKMCYIEGEGSVNTDCNSVISNNSISVCATADVTNPSPIYIYGKDLTDNESVLFERANYIVSNLKVKDNTINTECYGIRAYDMKNSELSGNQISGNRIYNGIYLDSACESNAVSDNTISGFENGINFNSSDNNSVLNNAVSAVTNNGIVLQSGSSGNSVKSNKISDTSNNGISLNTVKNTEVISNAISNTGKQGIYVGGASELKCINSNNISNTAVNGIYVNASTVSDILSNTINSSKNNGISMSGNSTVNNINKNSISKASGDGIYLSSVKAASVCSNTISSGKKHGINLVSKTEIQKLSSNSISGCSKNGIYVAAASAINELKSNTVSKNKNSGMLLYGKINNISSNTFSSNSYYAMYFAKGSKAVLYNNNCSSNKKGVYYSTGKKNYKFTNLSKPAITLSQKKRDVTVKWKKVKDASKYQLCRANSSSGKYSVISNPSAKKTSYKNKKLKKGKKYYYKMRAVRNVNGITQYSSYSGKKNIKIK